MAGVSGMAERDRRTGQTPEAVGAPQARQSGSGSSACGRRVDDIAEIYEREVRDLPCFEYRTMVVIETVPAEVPRLRGEGGKRGAIAEPGTL
jgi:hypothetical protein